MLKLDGLTIKLCYENGELVEASTRGEGLIHSDDFEEMKGRTSGNSGKEICNARNLASGSIRVLDPSVCKERHVYFYAFNVIEGMEAFGEIADSRGKLLAEAGKLGFAVCPFTFLPEHAALREIEERIGCLRALAEEEQIPIDGMVLSRTVEKGRLVETLHCVPTCMEHFQAMGLKRKSHKEPELKEEAARIREQTLHMKEREA